MRFVLSLILSLTSAAGLFAQDPLQRTWGTSQKAADYLATYTEPAAHGEAAAAVWEDDKEACFYIRVDGNWGGDHNYWLRANDELHIPISFYLVSHAIPGYGWSPWDSVRALYAHGNCIGSHSAYHNPYDLHADGTLNLYIEYHDSKDTIESKMHAMFPDYVCRSFAGPGGGWPNDGDSVRMYFNVSDAGHIDASTDIRPIKEKIMQTLDPLNRQYYRGQIQYISHNLATQAVRDEVWGTMSYAAANRERLWLPTREHAAMYSAERRTHVLTVSSVMSDQIRFGLTDSLHDTIFTYPLTIKVCVDSSWDNMTAAQNGTAVPWFFKMENGLQYALVKAVPDQGEVILTKTTATTVYKPQIAPRFGSYRDSVLVSMVCATTNAEIRYTTDGSDPDGSSLLYTGPFALKQSAQVRARGYKTGLAAGVIDSVFLTVIPDTVPARVTAAAAAGAAVQVIVSFNEKVTAATAEVPGNYSVSDGITVSAAQLLSNGMAVTLTVSALTADQAYTVTASNIADQSGNVMTSGSASFTFTDNALEANLQGYWTFDEAAGIQAAVDHSGHGNTGVFMDGAVAAPGSLGYALKLDGDNDLMNIGRSTFNFGATDEMTIAFWFKYTENWIGDFANSQDYTKPYNIYPQSSYNQIRFYLRTSAEGTGYLGSSGPFTRDVWYHCTCTYKDSLQAIYLNGALDKTKVRTGGLVTSSSEDILGLGFKGYMDEIRYYDRALNASEVLALTQVTGATVCAAPIVSPDSGFYTDEVTITLSSATAGADIYYTIDGTTPDMQGIHYTGPVTLETGMYTLQAIAYAAGMLPSATTGASFTVIGTPEDPVFTPAGGTYSDTVEVIIECATPGAVIYYTTDGSVPDTSGAYYESPVVVAENTVIRAMAWSYGLGSSVVQASYIIDPSSILDRLSLPAGNQYLVPGVLYDLQGNTVSFPVPGCYIRYDADTRSFKKIIILE